MWIEIIQFVIMLCAVISRGPRGPCGLKCSSHFFHYRRFESRPARALWIINERIITVVGAILGKSDFVKRCNCTDITKNRFKHQIKNDDIFLTYISRLLPMEKTAYEFVH